MAIMVHSMDQLYTEYGDGGRENMDGLGTVGSLLAGSCYGN